jgi:hypothetical protein
VGFLLPTNPKFDYSLDRFLNKAIFVSKSSSINFRIFV